MLKLKSYKIYLVIAVLIGIVVRLYGLDIQGLWFDELYSVCASYNKLPQAVSWIFSDTLNPHLYQFFIYFWAKIFGNSEFMVRLPSAVIGIITIFCSYFLTKKFFDKYTAACTTILISFSATAIIYSQEARAYSFLLLFSLITTLLWLNILKNFKQDINNKEFKFYSGFAILTVFTHYIGSIFIFIQLLYLFLTALFLKIHRKKILKLIILIFLMFFPWLLVNQLFSQNVTEPHKPYEKISISLDFFFNKYLVIFLILPIFIKFKSLKKLSIDKIKQIKLYSPSGSLILLSGITFLVIYLSLSFINVGYSRYFIVILPAVYLLISYFVISNSLLSKDRGVIYIFILGLIAFIIFIQGFYKPYKQQWREASKEVMEKYDADSIIFVDRYPQLYTYYFDRYKKSIPIHMEYLSSSKQLKGIGKKYKHIFIWTSFHKIQDNVVAKWSKKESLSYNIKSYKDIYLYVFTAKIITRRNPG